MPQLKLFKRTWKRSEDTFVISSIVQATIRVILLLVGAALLWTNAELQAQLNLTNQVIFIISAVLCATHIIVYIILAFVSGQGGVLETHKRQDIGLWVGIHLIVMLFELIFYSLSIWQMVSLFRKYEGDAYSSYVAILSWCCILIISIVFEIIDWIRHYDKLGKIKYDFYQAFLYGNRDNKSEDELRDLVNKMYKLQQLNYSKFISTYIARNKGGNNKDKTKAINAVADEFTDLLIDLDMTKSDALVGLMLLRWQSNEWIDGNDRIPAKYISEQTSCATMDLAAPLNRNAKNSIEKLEKNWLHVSRVSRYSHLANAAYGWTYGVVDRFINCKCFVKRYSKVSCCNPAAPKSQIDIENGITGPGCCVCAGENYYLTYFMQLAQLDSEDILAYDISDELYVAGSMLVIDDATEAIVLIVRGTLSGNDAIVDLLVAGEPLRDEDYNLPPEKRLIGHSGMVRTARNLVRCILEKQLLESAKRRRPNYPLVICGHSLGAGLVSLMSVLLKPHYPELKAYAYSPPGPLMNKNLADFTRDYLCSVTIGVDLVARLGAATVEDLRARIFHALSIYKTPKFKTLRGGKFLSFLRVCSKLPDPVKLDEKTGDKLIDPDMNDAYETPIGSRFKPYLADRIQGASKIDRLLPTERSLMRWKNPDCKTLLTLPRPYPRRLYPKSLLHPSEENFYSVDLLIESFPQPIPSGRILHLLEADESFEFEGSQSNRKHMHKPNCLAVWTDPNGFNSILVHPEMLQDHMPFTVSARMDSLYRRIIHPGKVYPKNHIINWREEMQWLENGGKELPSEESGKHCRIRKLN